MDNGQLTTEKAHAFDTNYQLSTVNSQLKKKPRCPKCGGMLKRDTVTMAGEGSGYAMEDEIKCLECGWRISRTAEEYLGKFRELPLKIVKGYVFDTRATGECEKTVATLNIEITGCCAVVNCAETFTVRNRSGLCKRHQSRQRQWEMSKQTTPQPFIPAPGQPGKVINNPACSGMRIATRTTPPAPPVMLPPVTMGRVCAVRGCDTGINLKSNTTGLCFCHNNNWLAWANGDRSDPQPFIADPKRPGKLKKNSAKGEHPC